MPAQSQLGFVLRTHLPKLLSTCRSRGPVQLQQPLSLSPFEASLSAHFTRPEAVCPTVPSLKEILSHGTMFLQPTIVSTSQTVSLMLLQPVIVPATRTVTPVLRLMMPHERAVRLPTAVPLDPVSTPNSSAPQALPQHPTAANREVLDPCGELVPQEMPQHTSQVGVTIECVHPEIRKNQRSMKKHKLLKMRKKNKVKNEYRILMDITRKEKAFMMEQMAIMREADAFSAEQYVQGRLEKVNTKTVPRYWNEKPQIKSIVMEQMFKAGIKIPGYEK